MIYLFINGNCGNQFFQYAFARCIAEKSGDKISICWHDQEDMNKRNQLKHFNVKVENNIPCHKKNIMRTLYYKYRNYYCNSELEYDAYDYKFAGKFEKFGIYNVYHGFYPFKLKKHKNTYITGYYESSKYFDNIKDIIQNELQPIEEPLEHNIWLYNKIKETESVCVTIRRGDFLSDEYKQDFYVCTEQYFYNAVERIRKIKNKITLFIFSDDVNWVKNNMSFGEIETYYECGTDPIWEKIRLMYSCKNFIISNSTFSWWAQYLSRNDDKVVIAPDVWRRDGLKSEDIYQENWLLVKTNDSGEKNE